MPTYRLELEYDGTDFHGWQIQSDRRTVQGALRDALARVCGEPPPVEGAGRTDAGVHAIGQVASFTTAREFEPRRLLHALMGLLPQDIHVYRVGRAADGFSARRSATARRYRYQWLRAPSALLRRTHAVLPSRVDAGRMRAAASCLLGDHDFTAFAAAASGGGRSVVSEVCIVETESRLAFEIEADRFLHNMVRRLAGALVEIGRGTLQPEALAAALTARVPQGPCLPARGLFLVAVRYPADAAYEAGAAARPQPVPPWEFA